MKIQQIAATGSQLFALDTSGSAWLLERGGQWERVPDLPKEPKQDKLELEDPLEEEFEKFYEAYGLKKGRGQAYKAFRAARKKSLFDDIMNGVKAYHDERKRLEAAEEFVPQQKHPSTWLNGECWKDDSVKIEDLPVKESKVNVTRGGTVYECENPPAMLLQDAGRRAEINVRPGYWHLTDEQRQELRGVSSMLDDWIRAHPPVNLGEPRGV